MITTFFIILLLAGLAAVLFLVYSSLSLWFQARVSGVPIGLFDVVFMRFRKVPPKLIVESKITAAKAGLSISTEEMESHLMAGGDVKRVVKALISAEKAKIPLDFKSAANIDLAGQNVLEAVEMSIKPIVIQTDRVAAVAKDGILLRATARVTVRANIKLLVGGAGKDTILAKVAEGIATTMGSAQTHKDVLESPDLIVSKKVLEKGLDKGTAYEILSIDIANVEVGENIGAKVATERAEADKIVAQASAEGKRSMASADEQQMRARVQEMKAKVVEAEAKVMESRQSIVESEAKLLLSMAVAVQKGQMGLTDYYQIKNVQAETKMRESIGASVSGFVNEYGKMRQTQPQKPPIEMPTVIESAIREYMKEYAQVRMSEAKIYESLVSSLREWSEGYAKSRHAELEVWHSISSSVRECAEIYAKSRIRPEPPAPDTAVGSRDKTESPRSVKP